MSDSISPDRLTAEAMRAHRDRLIRELGMPSQVSIDRHLNGAIPMGISHDDMVDAMRRATLPLPRPVIQNPPTRGLNMNQTAQAMPSSMRRPSVHINIEPVTNGYILRYEHGGTGREVLAVAKTIEDVHEEVTRLIASAQLDRTED